MGYPMFFLDAENDDSRFLPAVTRHTYNVDGMDAVQLELRLSHLERALSLRGGKVTSIKRRVPNTGRPQAVVRYELPTTQLAREPAA
jgi:hypothetical protein